MTTKSISSGSNPSGLEPSNQSVMAMLTDSAESTKSLAGKFDKLESQGLATSFPVNPGSHSHALVQFDQQLMLQAQTMHH